MKVLVLLEERSGIDLFKACSTRGNTISRSFGLDEFWQEIKDTRDFEKIYETFIKRYKSSLTLDLTK